MRHFRLGLQRNTFLGKVINASVTESVKQIPSLPFTINDDLTDNTTDLSYRSNMPSNTVGPLSNCPHQC